MSSEAMPFDDSPVAMLERCENHRRQLLAETRDLIVDAQNWRDESTSVAEIWRWNDFIAASEELAAYFAAVWFSMSRGGRVKRYEKIPFPRGAPDA